MKPQPCESCAAGNHRARCATYPVPCEDILEYYESGVADERAEQQRVGDDELLSLRDAHLEAVERAEKAEEQAINHALEAVENCERAEKAEAKLAEMVRVVRTYERRIPAEVSAILAGVELPTKHEAPKCRVCGGEQQVNGEWCRPSDPEWDHPFEPEEPKP
jgi:hypothetical protein